jgi:hypothetical protein
VLQLRLTNQETPVYATRPFRGTAGARIRENDESHHLDAPSTAGREMTARYSGICADTGAAIRPGDLIRYDRASKRSVLIQRSGEGRTSGGTFYRNKAGRCEDAPCCGCCTI